MVAGSKSLGWLNESISGAVCLRWARAPCLCCDCGAERFTLRALVGFDAQLLCHPMRLDSDDAGADPAMAAFGTFESADAYIDDKHEYIILDIKK